MNMILIQYKQQDSKDDIQNLSVIKGGIKCYSLHPV